MGCVALSERFFRDGKISAKRIERARVAARLELEPVQAAFRRRGWEHCGGQLRHGARDRRSDPRARSAGDARSPPTGSSASSTTSIEAGHIRELNLAAITDERRAGVSRRHRDPRRGVRRAGHRSRCGSPTARCAKACCYDMVGRFTDEDARERTVRAMQQRYHVDVAQAERVEATVLDFLRAGARDLEARGSAGATWR